MVQAYSQARQDGCRLGFILSSLGATQLAYHLLEQGDAVLSDRTDLDVVVFFQNVTKTWTTPTFAAMNISEAYGFTGVAIATDLDTAGKLARFPGPSKRFFYVWDLEWLRPSGRFYEDYASVYCKLPLIARSDSHARLIEYCWNRPVHAVVPNCDLAGIAKVVAR